MPRVNGRVFCIILLSTLFSQSLAAKESISTGPVFGRQIKVIGVPSITLSGTGVVDDVVHVTSLPTAYDEDSTDTLSDWRYVWQVSSVDVHEEREAGNITHIPTYKIRAGDGGKTIRVCLKAVASSGYPNSTQHSESACSNELLAIGSAPFAESVGIQGSAVVGNILTGTYSYKDADGDTEGTSTFQWFKADNIAGINKHAISGATTKTYKVQTTDRNKFLFFGVTPKASSGNPDVGIQVISLASSQVPGTAPVVSELLIRGTITVGNVLTGSYSYSDSEDDADTSTFQWYRADNLSGTSNKQAILGATSLNYVIQNEDQNKFLIFEVTPKSETGIPSVGTPVAIATSTMVQGAAPTAQNVYISGTVEVDQTLTGFYSYYDSENDNEGGTSYQWYLADNPSGSNKQAISGANEKSYTVKFGDSNKHIIFAVTPRAATGQPNVGLQVLSSISPVVPSPLCTVVASGKTYSCPIKNGEAENLGLHVNGSSLTDYAKLGWGDAHSLCYLLGKKFGGYWSIPQDVVLAQVYRSMGDVASSPHRWPSRPYWTSTTPYGYDYVRINMADLSDGTIWSVENYQSQAWGYGVCVKE